MKVEKLMSQLQRINPQKIQLLKMEISFLQGHERLLPVVVAPELVIGDDKELERRAILRHNLEHLLEIGDSLREARVELWFF